MDAIEARFEDPEAELDILLGELRCSFKIVVKREEPDWCAGTLGTFEFDAGDTISTDWIAKRFGGEKFQIKILDSNNKHLTSRRVRFPEPPRRDGVELVKGPNGPITILEAKAAEPSPPPQDNQMVGLLEKLLTAQQSQANSMTTMLLGRVQGLETLLTNKLTEPATVPVVPGVVPDPQSQLRQTLETVQAIEELKNVMGGGGEVVDGEPENPLYGALIEKVLDKFTSEPAKPSHQDPRQLNQPVEPSNLQLATLIKQRLKTMPTQERDLLLSHVFEDEAEETTAIAGQDDFTEVESLLTQEDREQLEDDGSGQNESQKVSPFEEPTLP